MSTVPPPAKRPAAPPPARSPATQSRPSEPRSFGVSSGRVATHHKVILYGPGGVGKTELASLIKACGVNPLFIDVEQGSRFLDVARVDPSPETWEELRDTLHNFEALDQFDAIVIDSLTKAEELAAAWTVANVPHEKGNKAIRSLEDYGFGKGTVHVYETFLNLFGDLDALNRRGKHIICIAHECTASVPNPSGEDWIRFEPRLQSPASGKSSIRHRAKEWADHLLFIGFDQIVSEDGKASGHGSRTIYPSELPSHWAKSRSLSDPIEYERGSASLWKTLLGKGE